MMPNSSSTVPESMNTTPLSTCSKSGNSYCAPAKKSQLPPTEEGEYYWSDLIGLKVVNRQGIELGEIRQLMETGAHDVLVVQNDENELLIPYVMGHYIDKVDLDQGEVLVDWNWIEEE